MSACEKAVLALAAAVLAAAALAACAGRWLIVDEPRPADAIVVLAGGANDVRYRKGLEMLAADPRAVMLVDARADETAFGKTIARLWAGYVPRSAGRLARRVRVCAIVGDSTNEETSSVARCLEALKPRAVLLVTSDYHTRRALSIFKKRLPRYDWSVASAPDPQFFGPAWWRRRPWAKTFLLESAKFAWWEAVDRWRPAPAVNDAAAG